MSKRAKTIEEFLRPQKRFMRSVHLERDFRDKQALSGYILTEHSRDALERIASGLRPSSGHRAWRITGNYGAGKSSFALLLAHWFAGNAQALPPNVRTQIPYKTLSKKKPHVLPVLVTGARESLAVAIARGIIETCGTYYSSRRTHAFIKPLKAFIEADKELRPPDEDLINTISVIARRIIKDGKGSGLLLIIDELGKFLEYATLHPERQDIYLLQRLAETASRSKENPFYLVALLHQGFHEYAHSLSEVAQREWEKVAARFEEILFDQPLEQLTALIGAALNVKSDQLPDSIYKEASSALKHTVDGGWFGITSKTSFLSDTPSNIFPLHPSVLPVLARFFRRFGQNERSLFSFLLSNESFGLRAFTRKSVRGDAFFRLHHFYDYVRCNFGHRLSLRSYRSHWNQIDSMIQSYVPSAPCEIEILKTVGILNLLDADDLRPTEDMILLATAPAGYRNKRKEIAQSLANLSSRTGILYNRGRAGGYCLWPYTSVNLEMAYEQALEAIPTTINVSSRIQEYVETRPVVARRHYITKGNLRYFDVKYCPMEDLHEISAQCGFKGDGLIVIPLCETESERQQAIEFAESPKAKKRQGMVVAVPPPLNNLAGVISEAERWEWVSRNTPELENDRYANEEVSRLRKSAQANLESRLAAFVSLHYFSGETSLQCFHAGEALDVCSGRDLLELLSQIFDELYKQAPQIKNELVNRQFLSSAAAAARMRLIERILEYSAEPILGMDPKKRPPEMSMYLSVLKRANLHRAAGNCWVIGPPEKKDDNCCIRPAWQEIDAVLQHEPDARVNVSDIASALRRPPYGVRDGIIPILLASYIVANRDDVAVYEEGSFCPVVHSEEFLRLTKSPESFEIQYCRADGVRSEVLNRLWDIVADGNSKSRGLAILDVVRPICVFVADLPEYTRHTKILSRVAVDVRNAILAAHDPTNLLFCELPKACECKPITSGESSKCAKHNTTRFIKCLSESLAELRMAYSQLLDRILQQIRTVLDLPNEHIRDLVAKRVQAVLPNVVEPRLKSFCLRLSDDDLPNDKWLESLGSFLARRPPSKWNDTDEGQYQHELTILGTRFGRVEGMLFDKQINSGKPSGVRITLTRADGCERDRVLHADNTKEESIADTEAAILKLLSDKGSVGIAAASRALWKVLSDSGESDE